MLHIALTIFLSALLLFQIQPIIAKYILPWYGGTATVWSVCLLFFQLALLAGYSYAHILYKFLSPARQALTHCIFVFAALLILPVTPNEELAFAKVNFPALNILLLLLSSVGIPFFLISATGPLFQYWFKFLFPSSSPYRLYALSNAGSLLGLLSYPFLVEPLLTLQMQTWLWSAGFTLYALLGSVCAWAVYRAPFSDDIKRRIQPVRSSAPGIKDKIIWIALAMSGSVLLLATTNQICLDIAVVPFLWVLPLSIYLLSFILCFNHNHWYKRAFWIPLFFISCLIGFYILILAANSSIFLQITIHTIILFSGCMICHGELTRNKPHPEYLTGFYLMLALGGALGGLFVSLIAPLIFNGYWELQVIWVIVMILTGVCLFRTPMKLRYWQNLSLQTGWITLCAVFALILFSHIVNIGQNIIVAKRNFYGVLRVLEITHPDLQHLRERRLLHGAIKHGSQIINDEKSRRMPTTYYGFDSGIGIAIHAHPDYHKTYNRFRIGIVGMGTGTIASLTSSNDFLKFYEINPEVITISQTYFTFLRDTATDWQVILGDARISLMDEYESGGSQEFDVLGVDAFSSDAIPVHLLTLEAFQLYWRHIKTNGILAVHISNRHLNLENVVRLAGQALNKHVIKIANEGDNRNLTDNSIWILLTNNDVFLRQPSVIETMHSIDETVNNPALWTDSYSNLFSVLK